MLKKLLILILTIILICSTTACGKITSMQNKDAGKEGTYKIGLSMCNLTIEYLALLRDEIMEYQSSLGMDDTVELIVLDAMSDPLKQNSQVDNLILQNVDCIIMIPFDRVQQQPAVEAAKKAQIPMVEFCASTISNDKVSYVGSDDKESGSLLAGELMRVAEERNIAPKIVVLHGPTGQNAEVMRHTGLEEVLKEYPQAEIVSEINCEWDRSKALSSVGNLLQSGTEFNMIFSENDEMAMGALVACEAANRTDVMIGGVDALPDALQAVINERLVCTVFQNAKAQSQQVFDVALAICRGEEVKKEYPIPYELVTKENAKNYE